MLATVFNITKYKNHNEEIYYYNKTDIEPDILVNKNNDNNPDNSKANIDKIDDICINLKNKTGKRVKDTFLGVINITSLDNPKNIDYTLKLCTIKTSNGVLTFSFSKIDYFNDELSIPGTVQNLFHFSNQSFIRNIIM